MTKKTKNIDKLIINSPHKVPELHWNYIRETKEWELKPGRRQAGYLIANPRAGHDDPGEFVPIELVNAIRPRVDNWRKNNYPGITGITKRLLQHWYEREEGDKQFFYAQLEAIETIIWLTEAPEAEKVGIEIPSDGGDFSRWCTKLATGTGKTVVMAMLIAWQALNKVTYPQDNRYSKYFLIVAPGLTVKSRLSVLKPSDEENYYDEFNIVPQALREKLRQSKIHLINWHKMQWDSEEKIEKKKGVDKRGAKSDEAYTREVLEELSKYNNLVVINDEAHHAWRVAAESKVGKIKAEDIEATIWVGGLDRIHKTRKILRCFDFTATPFAPTGKKTKGEALFPWVISDFGLNDAIETGLVKTPRVVVRDDSKTAKDLKPRLYHIYMDEEVKDDLNSKAEETVPLPDLVRNAYYLLGKDWYETKKDWEKSGHPVPPVMITVANRIETSARIKYEFDHNQIDIPDLCVPEKTLQIDSKMLDNAEAETEGTEIDPNKEKLTKKEEAELLRLKVDTIGKTGEPGEQIQNVISVGMLSEGWDAKTVTQIMGLRAFSSQLLCEQVIGRGLRRVSYELEEDGLFAAEYVNVFGVPFAFLPHEGGGTGGGGTDKPKTEIKADLEKKEFKIDFPNIIRINKNLKPQLSLDLSKVEKLIIDPYESITEAELQSIIAGKPNPAALSEIDLKEIGENYRIQKIIFETAARIFNYEKENWQGRQDYLLAQIIKIVEQFINSDRIEIKNYKSDNNDLRRRIYILLNMNKVIQHIWDEIRQTNTEKFYPEFDPDYPKRSTANMRTWYTTKPVAKNEKSHINFTVIDSKWEDHEAYQLDKHSNIKSWVKNDHLGFYVMYVFKGVRKKYYPDFIIEFKNGVKLILETKGQKTDASNSKRKALQEWVKAVNYQGGFGKWHEAISYEPSDLEKILNRKYE